MTLLIMNCECVLLDVKPGIANAVYLPSCCLFHHTNVINLLFKHNIMVTSDFLRRAALEIS